MTVESRMSGNAHVRFGGAGRGDGPPEKAEPRPGPTLLVRWFAQGLIEVRRRVQRGAPGDSPVFSPVIFRAGTCSWREPSI